MDFVVGKIAKPGEYSFYVAERMFTDNKKKARVFSDRMEAMKIQRKLDDAYCIIPFSKDEF